MMICLTGSGCDGFTPTIDLRYPQNGTIYSPGYPNNYGKYENCNWLIQAPPGQRVLLSFTKFDIEYSSQCSYDSVNIFDGLGISAPLLSKSCGDSLPSPVYSSGRYMYMRFTSDGSFSGEGFVAHYRALNSSSSGKCQISTALLVKSIFFFETGSCLYLNGRPCQITQPL